MVRDHFAEPVDLTIAHLQNPPTITQHGARFHLTKGDDLSDVVGAVLLLHIADNLTAPRLAKVDIEVGHRHPFRVQEALEQQAQLDGIKVGDRQRPSHNRTRTRPTARPHWNALILRPLDKVGNDQEVAGKTHIDDDADLIIEAVEVFFALFLGEVLVGRKPLFETSLRLLGQHLRLALKIARKAWQDRIAVRRRIGAALRDNEGVGDRLGDIVK